MQLNYQYLETQSSLSEMIQKTQEERLAIHQLQFDRNLVTINESRIQFGMPIIEYARPTTVDACIKARIRIQADFDQEYANLFGAQNLQGEVIPAKPGQSSSIEDEECLKQEAQLNNPVPVPLQFVQNHHHQTQIQQHPQLQAETLSPSPPAMLNRSFGNQVPSSNDSTNSMFE